MFLLKKTFFLQKFTGYASPYDGEISYIVEMFGCKDEVADYATIVKFLHKDGAVALDTKRFPNGLRCGSSVKISRPSVERLQIVDHQVLKRLRSDSFEHRIELEGTVQGKF